MRLVFGVLVVVVSVQQKMFQTFKVIDKKSASKSRARSAEGQGRRVPPTRFPNGSQQARHTLHDDASAHHVRVRAQKAALVA